MECAGGSTKWRPILVIRKGGKFIKKKGANVYLSYIIEEYSLGHFCKVPTLIASTSHDERLYARSSREFHFLEGFCISLRRNSDRYEVISLLFQASFTQCGDQLATLGIMRAKKGDPTTLLNVGLLIYD